MKRLTYTFGTLLMLAGCGGNDPPDSQCGGHGQPACQNQEFLMKEGGEIRLEYRVLPDLSEVSVAQSWFVTGQNPEKLASPPFNNCGDVGTMETTITPTMQAIMSRQFYDVGDSMTLTGAGKTINLTKHENVEDFRKQVEGIIYVKDAKSLGGVPVSDIVEGAEYTATFANGESPSDTIYMPRAWTTVQGPAFDGTVYEVVKDQDLNFVYNTDDSGTDANIVFIYFGAKDGSTKWWCAGENTGSITIPKDIVNQFGAEGSILVGVVRHKRIDFNGRNFDLIAINCKIQSFKVP